MYLHHEITPVIHKLSKSRDPYPHAIYAEGLFVGYRGVEKFGVEPMFPFGYGLSYSSFEYSDVSVNPTPDGCEVVFTVKNTGRLDASESAQVYLQPLNPSIIRPAYELKGFDKKRIAKGKSVEFRIQLSYSDFSYYDVASHSWKVDAGEYKILVGSSSSDIRLSVNFTVK